MAGFDLGESGVAGPTGNRYGDASGHACFAVAGPIERCLTIKIGDDDHEANMWAFAKAGFDRQEIACQLHDFDTDRLEAARLGGAAQPARQDLARAARGGAQGGRPPR